MVAWPEAILGHTGARILTVPGEGMINAASILVQDAIR
jgi:hypothetical protein